MDSQQSEDAEVTRASPLPSFLVIGAQKAGTTSLNGWLSVQPSLRLPPLKETHFFSKDELFAKGLGWYAGQFPRGTGMCGEIDPDYLSSSVAPGRAAQIYEGEQAPKLVVILRDPLGRAFSQWKMSVRRGLEDAPFGEALFASWDREQRGEERDGGHGYYRRGTYAKCLARWGQAFPKSTPMVLTFEQLVGADQREETFRRICTFIGLTGEPILPDFNAVENPASKPRSSLLNRVIHRRSAWRSAVGKLIPSQDLRHRIGVLMERMNTTPDESRGPVMDPIDGLVLKSMASDISELEALAGLNLDSWKDKLIGRDRASEADLAS
ncbi:MAG: sulfotransferase domain-containing protein [Planctomycetota bacterium]|nr:sulfotransferase domain-containing protein [Planctomycetota bacterium]